MAIVMPLPISSGSCKSDRSRRRRHSRGEPDVGQQERDLAEKRAVCRRRPRTPSRTVGAIDYWIYTSEARLFEAELFPRAGKTPAWWEKEKKMTGSKEIGAIQIRCLDVYAPDTLDQVLLQPLIRRRLADDPRAAPASAQVGLGAGLVPLGAVRLDLGDVERLDRFGSVRETGFGGHGGRGLGGLAVVLDEHAARDGAGSVQQDKHGQIVRLQCAFAPVLETVPSEVQRGWTHVSTSKSTCRHSHPGASAPLSPASLNSLLPLKLS